MPLINYLCECKNSKSKFYRQAKDALAFIICDKCGKEAKKSLCSPSTSSKIVVDNGFQARAIEVIPDIVEINQKRSEKDYTQDD
jgi:Fe2+ or Zn2+ uptake regulation protein